MAAMKIEVLANAEVVAQKAAEFIAAEARTAVAARGRFVVAVSGGHTPWVMLRDLASEDVPWKQMHVVQVDERVAPPVIPIAISLTFAKRLLAHAPLPTENIYPMPVEATDLEAAATAIRLHSRGASRFAASSRSRCTWAWDLTVTPPHSFPVIQC